MTTWFIPLTILIASLLGIGSLGYHDEQPEQPEHELYCEMVELWRTNEHLPPEQRPGWPPYKGECNGQD